MSLRAKQERRSKQTTEATKKIGFIGRIKLVGGIVPRLYEDWEYTPKCFVPYGEDTDEAVRAKVAALVKQHTGRDNADVYPAMNVMVEDDTSLTPNSRFNGSNFVSTETGGKGPRSSKRVGDFLFDHISPEFDEEKNEGKFLWAHISWQRLTETHGGDLSLTDQKETRNEWGMIITYIPSKKAAIDLSNALRTGEVTMDSLAEARGYDASGVRQIMAQLRSSDKGSGSKDGSPMLSGVGDVTVKSYINVQMFLEAGTMDFMRQNLKQNGGDVLKAAAQTGADPGDFAIAMNIPGFFKPLIKAEIDGGKGEQAAIKAVADSTGLKNANDLAIFLGYDEIPY